MYEKVGGVSADTDWFKHLETCDAVSSAPPNKKPRSKGKKRMSMEEENLDPGIEGGEIATVISKLEGIERKISVFDELIRGFECCICKGCCQAPMVSRCCKRIVGCSSCVERWLANESSCPLCRASGKISQRFPLKGFEELSSFFRMVEGPPAEASKSMATASQQVVVVDTDSDDFEHLPSFPSVHHSMQLLEIDPINVVLYNSNLQFQEAIIYM